MMFASVAVVASTLTWTLVTVAVHVALADAAAPELIRAVASAVAFVSAVVIVCTVLAALGAATFLRSSITGAVVEMQTATDRIARGDLDHRIASSRRDELGGLARDIDTMASRLQRLERARQEFIAGVSHELRTPLTVARGHAFTLRRGEHNEQRARRLALVESEIDRVAALVDDLLVAATLRIRQPQLGRRALEVTSLLEAAAARFELRAAERGVRVRAMVPRGNLMLEVDEPRMQQVLGNLLGNAVRHAHEGTEVVVGARRRPGGVLRLAVRNTGDPVPDTLHARLFEPFAQGAERPGAAGLGLAIARELVHAHNAALQWRSMNGVTEFWFDLPLAASSPRGRVSALRPGFAT